MVLEVYPAVGKDQLFLFPFEHRAGHLQELPARVDGGPAHGVAHVIGAAAGRGGGVERDDVGVQRRHPDLLDGDAQLFRGDL